MYPLSKLLALTGIPISPYSLLPGTTPIGETARIGNAEITYRQKNELLVIILYRSLSRPQGLANVFVEMKWLLSFIRNNVPEITRLATTAMEMEHEDQGSVPSPEKLLRFYKRYFNAVDDEFRDGQKWLKLEWKE